MRTWVYIEPDDWSNKLGYLRAGAVVDRSRSSAGTLGCAGGWYRIEPRGYVCVGKGASLDLEHPVVEAGAQRAHRGEPMPYRYVISRRPPPHLYFKLPTVSEQEYSEGALRAQNIALFTESQSAQLGPADPLPAFLAHGASLPKPYGADRPFQYRTHRGRAGKHSAFGLIATFDWTGRRFGLTTEFDLIPIDYTRVVRPSELRGLVIEQPGLPAFVIQHRVRTFRPDPHGRLLVHGKAQYRSGWLLTGRDNGRGYLLLETTEGVWLPREALRIAELREDPVGFAREGRKWIDLSIRRQLLVAYEGKRPVYATLVSTGRGRMHDPEQTDATVRGTFMIHAKHLSGTMDGDPSSDDTFDLRDVPYIQYFHQGYALHGAYWHDDFGRARSHGCINLAPVDAAWLFEWTHPQLPQRWHGVVNLNAGTLVYIHG